MRSSYPITQSAYVRIYQSIVTSVFHHNKFDVRAAASAGPTSEAGPPARHGPAHRKPGGDSAFVIAFHLHFRVTGLPGRASSCAIERNLKPAEPQWRLGMVGRAVAHAT
jgi:hypothetical protein